MQAPCKNIEQGRFELNWIYMGHLGAYMGHKKASDKQQNRDQEFLEKIQLSEKLRKRPKIHRMVKNIYELWISSYIRSAQR